MPAAFGCAVSLTCASEAQSVRQVESSNELMTQIEEQLERSYIPHLRSQFKRGLPVLFTGAGFSLGAKSILDEPMPSVQEVQAALWDLCFPNEAFDGSSLQDLYDHAYRRHPNQVEPLLRRMLTVDPSTLPIWYRKVFGLPWYRCYTLNIDDLTSAANIAFSLPRPLNSISATGSKSKDAANAWGLEVIHLNGTLDDLPDNVTFSLTQFADRLANPDPFYTDFTSDLISRPVVIIGTRLDEPPLWQHIEQRRARGGKTLRELRPRSYLVTPALALARKALLAELNIKWIPMTAEKFTSKVLGQLQDEARVGLQVFSGKGQQQSSTVPIVADLAVKPTMHSEFLLGQEPIWADLQSGRAAHRSIDNTLWKILQSKLHTDQGTLIVVTGTAGSGKSTSMMRVCLKLQSEGTPVGWIDRDSDISPSNIRKAMNRNGSPRVLAIDDADLYGVSLSLLVRDLVRSSAGRIVLVAIRSSKVDRVLNPTVMGNISGNEVPMPPLTDSDIDGLIQVLDENNRLGYLKGMSLSQRREQFQRQAGRQLLVAMIQATSNRRFHEKAIDELTELETISAKVYALIAVSHSFRFGLRREEVLVASGEVSNKLLNAVDQLANRKIVNQRPNGFIWARHRVIADVIHDRLQRSGQIKGVIEGLSYLAASKVRIGMSRSERPRRMLRILLSHDHLLRVLGLSATRNLYASLEQLLHWDYHYWLQRGSAEVEDGELHLAEQFLNQAKSISPNQPMVKNEWAYLLLKQAIENPRGKDAPTLVRQATDILEGLMRGQDRLSSYPYHVLGSQGLAWSRRGLGTQEKGRYLHSLLAMPIELGSATQDIGGGGALGTI